MTKVARPLLLLAALIALPASGGAECCNCSVNGTNCSACCFVDQDPSCTVFGQGSVIYCGCYCDPKPGGGSGGGGGVGCLRLDSRTSAMGADRRSGLEAKAYQLGGGLLNPGERRDGTYNFEEWALVSPEGKILRASQLEFAERVHASAERFRPREKDGGSAVLVIEDAAHPPNSRAIPLPKVAPIDIDAELPASLSGQEIWFRAEVGKDGAVEQVLLLNVPDDLIAGKFSSDMNGINYSLREGLKLRYADEARHRVVVFGLLRATLEGHLVMVRSRVSLPKCCCNGARCA